MRMRFLHQLVGCKNTAFRILMVISGGGVVKNPPAMQEMGVHSLGQEGLEYEVATRSSILAWKISWTEEPGGLQSIGPQRVDRTEYTHT